MYYSLALGGPPVAATSDVLRPPFPPLLSQAIYFERGKGAALSFLYVAASQPTSQPTEEAAPD